MAQVSITTAGTTHTVNSGGTPVVAIKKAAKVADATLGYLGSVRIPALNQKFSDGDNVTISGGEIITFSLT
jgi:hypothetical protein